MGLFDDLMPSKATEGQPSRAAGFFDDLVPGKRAKGFFNDLMPAKKAEPVKAEADDDSWWDTAKNVAAGIGERIGDATGGLVRGVAGIAEAGGDFMDRNVGTLVKDKDGYTWRRLTEEEAAQPSSVTTLGNKAAGASEAVDFGYEPGTTWEQVKGSPLKNFIPFAIEQGLVSTPDMVAAVAALPAYVVARTGELGQERAQNDGVGNARVEDLIKVLPAAAASALLERLGAKGMFGLDEAVGGIVKRGVKAGVKEAGTEAAQEAGEYAATTVGTEKGFDPVEMADRAAAGAVAGGVYGAGAGAVSATGQKLFKSGDEVVFNDGPAGEEAAGPYHGKKAKVGESFTDANGQTRYEVTFEDGQKAFPTEELLVKPERPTLAGDAPTAAPGNLFGDLVPADKPATVTPAQREEMVAPPPTVDRERLDSPRLTPADRASPIPNDIIDDGKALIERAIAGESLAPATSEPQSTGKAENPLPEVSGPPSASPIERAILRKAGSADDEIDVMSREERAADMKQAMDAGVSANAQDVAAAETYARPVAQPVAQPAANPPLSAANPQPSAGAPQEVRSDPQLSAGPQAEASEPAVSAQVERSPIARRDMERDTAVTSAGRQVPVQYAVVEAKSLVASQTDEGRANADYPTELQPRDRSRGVSQTQIQSISSNINPRLLDKSPRASDGAPVIAADGTVESGNGRVLALRKAYSEGGAEGYRQHLASQGYPVDGMSEPVLVRVREGQMASVDRQAFTREANERDTLAMSSTEQAMADANTMSDGLLSLYRGGDIDAASNREFVRAYIRDVVGQNDQARMIGADGALSQEAVRRVQTGLLGKAYADPDLVASLSESTETNIKAIGGAMTDVSAEWAQMRSEAAAGRISKGADQSAGLIEAVRVVERARKEGMKVADLVNQRDIFTGKTVSPVAEGFLRLMYRNQNSWTQPVSRERLAEALRYYVTEARKTSEGVDLLGETAPTPDKILAKAKERQDGPEAARAQEGLALRSTRNDAARQDVRPSGGDRAVTTERGQPAEGGTESARAGNKDAGKVERTSSGPTASWIIRNKATGEVVMETFDRAKVKALNTDKYEAVPVQEYLAGLNKRGSDKPAASLREKPTAYHIRETVGDVTTEFVLTDKFRDQAEALTEKLRAALDKAGLKDIGLRVSESIRMIVDGKAAEADGRYFRKTIDIALDAADPISTLNHESIHALRRMGLFSTSEWSILSSKSKREWVKRYNIEDRYEGFPDWAQVEEGIAHAYADWAKGEKTSSLVGRVFERIQTFVEALRNALRGMGFKSADSIFKQVSEGETGERSRDQFGRFAGPMYQAAWHGSPHQFDKFSTDYMGTGEGAQAFGWGLYFTGRREIAEYYRDSLTDSADIRVKDDRGGEFDPSKHPDKVVREAALWLEDLGKGNVAETISEIERGINQSIVEGGKGRAMIAHLQEWQKHGFSYERKKGRLYKVDVPEDSELLDWDKGISRQPPGIQEKLATVYEDADPASDDYDANEPFQTVYYRLVQKFGSERGVSEALRAAGIPGHKFLDGGSRSKGDGSYNYVIYDDSRISVEAMFSLAERTGGIADKQGVPRVNAVTAALGNRIMNTIKRGKNDGESVGDYTHRMLIDYLQPLKTMIEKAGGAPQDTMDAYLQARLAEDASLARIQSIHDNHVTPMIDVLAKAGATLEDLHRYAYALHAEERNRVVGLRNEPDSDFYKAVTDPNVKGASGWSTNEAKAALRELQKDKAKFAGLMKARTYLRAIVDQNLLDQKKAGLISAETFDSLTQQWQNYVPLRNEEADGDGLPGRGRGFDVRGNEFKAATGRYSEAENVVAWTIAAAERTQLRAGKNAVGKAMLRFINHVDPKGETIAKVYWTGDEGFGDIDKAPTVYRRELDKDGKVVNRKVPPSTISPDMFSAKVGGKSFYIKFADEKVGLALKKMGQSDMNMVFRVLRKASVWQSIINTRLNPVFAPINILRDAQAATVHMLDDKFGAAGTAKALASVPQAWGALWRNTRGKKGDGEWDKVAAEYRASGGKISFDSNFNSIEDSLKALRKQVAAASRKKGGIVQTWKAFTKLVGDLNDTAENGIRLAAFKAARDKGMTPQRAAFLARDLTVDFKKHGEYGPSMNAYSAFFNASIQGSYNVGKRVLLSKTARRVAGGLILQGILVDMMNRAFSGDDDDGESYYSKLVRNEGYKLERQVVLFYGSGKGDYVSFPLPYGYNALYHLGLQIGATANGDVDPLEAIGNAARVTFDAYNPLGSGGSVVTMLSPTLVDPLIELGENRNFAGAPITPTRYPGDFEPDSQKKFSTNPEIMQMLAEGLNAATGGNDIEPGMIDVSPETIEHLWNYVSGGIGRFVGQTIDVAGKVAAGEEVEHGNVPLWRSFRAAVGDDSKRGEYYRQREQVQAAKDYLKAYQERGDQEGLAEFIDRNKVAVDSIGAFDGAEKGLRKIRKGKRAIEGDDTLSAADKRERLKPLEEAELNLMTQARLAYARARKASAE